MTINPYQSLNDAKEYVKISSMEEISKTFTEMVNECKGSKGCGGEESEVYKIINHFHQLGAICINNEDSQQLSYSYQIYANPEEQLEMERLCPNIDLTKPEHQKPKPLTTDQLKEIGNPIPLDILMIAIAKKIVDEDGRSLDAKITETYLDQYLGEGNGDVILDSVEYLSNLYQNITAWFGVDIQE